MTSKLKSVVVIGGGVAGLACATKLASTPGFDITLLEASDRIGGRVKSAKFGDRSVELGAQWVHGEKGNSIFSLVNPFGILEDDMVSEKFGLSGMFVTQHGEFLSEDLPDKVTEVMEKMEEIGESAVESNEPLGQFASRTFWKYNDEKSIHESESVCNGILDWIHRFQNSIDGAESWFVTSCRGQLEYAHCDGNPTISWKHPASYNTLIEILLHGSPILDANCNHIPDWIHLQKEVGSIVYNVNDDEETGDVIVHCNDGTKYTADHVVSTASLGVLKHSHATLFQPPLSPEKVNAIENIGFGTVDKIFLEFSSIWWPENTLGFNLVWDDCCKVNENWILDPPQGVLLQEDELTGIPIWCRSLLGFYTLKNHPTTLFTWVTGPPADLMETLDDETLKAELVKVLQQFVGSVFSVPPPIGILRSNWKTNSHIRGSYSFRTIHSEDKAVSASQLAEPIFTTQKKPVVCFAGEATHSSFYSTVHGAYETGLREAERIINHGNETKLDGKAAVPDDPQEEDADGPICCTLLNLA